MFTRDFLTRWEGSTVELDDSGVSEAYFPVWGITDVDGYLAQSNRYRAALKAQQMTESEAVAQSESSASSPSDAPLADASNTAELSAPLASDHMQQPAGAASPEPAVTVPVYKRVAWGGFYWIKRVIIILLICLIGTVVMTMIMNPGFTFSETLGLLAEKFSALKDALTQG